MPLRRLSLPCPYRAADFQGHVTQGGGEYALPWAKMLRPFRAKTRCVEPNNKNMFQFRLEPLIKIRDNVLKECQAELAKAYDARRILEEHLQEVERQLTEGTETARNLMQPGNTVNVDYLLGIRRQEMFLLAKQEEIKQKMQEIDEEIERRRDAVVAANKELKILEKLKEKRHEQYLDDEKREETKAMNEIAGRSKR